MSSNVAADYLNVSESLLAKMRMVDDPRDGPPYAKIGRLVIYRRLDLDAWLAERLVK